MVPTLNNATWYYHEKEGRWFVTTWVDYDTHKAIEVGKGIVIDGLPYKVLLIHGRGREMFHWRPIEVVSVTVEGEPSPGADVYERRKR